MSRWKAAAIHLSISILLGAIVLALLFGVWYPQPYFSAAGGEHLIIVLLGVDLVLGPLLTSVVFKSGKKSLRFDLSVIGLLQLAALVYGLHVIVQARPVFIVAVENRFSLVAANQIDPDDLVKGKSPQFATLSWIGPRLVASRVPKDRSALAGKSLHEHPEFYVEYSSEVATLLTHAKPLPALRKLHMEAAPIIDGWLQAKGRSDADVMWLPITAPHANLTMLLDAKTGAVLGALPINPW
jgi:hypothetical protein